MFVVYDYNFIDIVKKPVIVGADSWYMYKQEKPAVGRAVVVYGYILYLDLSNMYSSLLICFVCHRYVITLGL